MEQVAALGETLRGQETKCLQQRENLSLWLRHSVHDCSCKSRVDSTRSASDARAGAVPLYTSDAEKEGALEVVLVLVPVVHLPA